MLKYIRTFRTSTYTFARLLPPRYKFRRNIAVLRSMIHNRIITPLLQPTISRDCPQYPTTSFMRGDSRAYVWLLWIWCLFGAILSESSPLSVKFSQSEHNNFSHQLAEIDYTVDLCLSWDVIFDLLSGYHEFDAFVVQFCRKVALFR